MKIKVLIIILNSTLLVLGSFCLAQNTNIDSLLILIKKDKQDSSKVIHSNYLSQEYTGIGHYDTALYYSNAALQLAQQIHFKKGIAGSYANIGSIYYYHGNYPKALDYYLKALKLDEELKNKNRIAKRLGNIGLVYWKQNDYPKALDYYFKALKIDEELGNKNGITRHFCNIGSVYFNQSDYSEALDYYFKALKLMEDRGEKNGISTVFGNIGAVFIEQKNYSKALDFEFKALKMDKKLGDKNGIARHMSEIGSIYTKTGKFEEAEQYLKSAYAIDESIGAKDDLMACEEQISSLYSTTGRYKQALIHYKKAIALKDTLFSQENKKQLIQKEMNFEFDKKEAIAKAEQKYETEKKIHEISLLKKEKEIEINQLKKNIYLIIILSILLVLIILVVYNFNRIKQIKKHSNELIKLQKKGMLEINVMQENERINIARDLHDSIGQILAGIKLNFNNFRKDFRSAPVDNADTYNKLSNLIDDACSEVRVVSHQMMPKTLIISGLKEAVEEFVSRYYTNSGVKFDIIVHELNINDKTIEIQLFRIIQEIISNIIKHAKADSVVIAIVQNEENLSLLIEDNGIGINNSAEKNGLGLNNIASRVNSMNGSFVIERNVNQGTIANVKIQLDKIR